MHAKPASPANTRPDPCPPSPDGGWSQDIVTLQDAIVVPPITSALTQDCGVIDNAGRFCAHSATWRGARALMTEPEGPVKAARTLAGRHLFAGQLWSHFGHFLAESISRLWALDHIKKNVESIVFIPKRPDEQPALKGYQKEFFDLLGITIPVQILDQPTQVEDLIVPGQGFGLGAIAAGTPAFRAYMARAFAPGIKPDGPPRLYLSRSRLGGQEGSIVLEDMLEANLEKSGYVAYHPQTETLGQQIARYRAAEKIIGPDGSAFHLFGFVANDTQKAAVVLRRNSNVFLGLANQIRHFAGIKPVLVNAVVADWIPDHKSSPGRYSFGQLDFEQARQTLAENGFIDPDTPWQIPRFRQVKQAMMARAREKGRQFLRVKAGEPAGQKPSPTRDTGDQKPESRPGPVDTGPAR